MQTVVERLVVPNTALRTQAKSQCLIVFFCLLAVVLGGTEAWLSRNEMYSDGISYMDIGDAFSLGQLSEVVNAYWSPLYSWVLALASWVARPSPASEIRLVRTVNWLMFVANL